MPKRCAVPNCNSHRRGENLKRSVFRVPRDTTLLKRWEESIPGIIKLDQMQIVCDKHFKAKDISREWVKYDSNGQIIARVPYKRPKLKEDAVPSQFYDMSTYGSDPSHEYTLIPTNENDDHLSKNSLIDHSIEPELMQVTDTLTDTLTDTSCDALFAVNDASSLLLMDVSNCNPLVSYNSLADEKPFKVSSSIVIRKQVSEGSESTSELSMIVPDSWSVAELRVESGQHILFSYAITKFENGMHCPVTQKYVTLDANRTLNYYVYGCHVNQQKIKLDHILNKNEMLPDILIKFKKLRICNGLCDNININLIPANRAYQDNIQRWRSKDCSLISETKRCKGCVKDRKYILQRITRMKNRSTLHRIHNVSNPIDQCKLSEMRIRNRRERQQKHRAKERVKHLMMYIKEQEAQIARIQNSILDARCAELNIPASKISTEENHYSSKQKE